MASLHKDPRGKSPFWYAAFTDALGVRRFKSTRTKDKELAKQIVAGWVKVARGGRNGTLTETQVRSVLSELLEQATGEPLHFATVKDYFADWLKDKAGGKAHKTAVRYAQMTESFLVFLGKRAGLALGAISPADLRKWREGLTKAGRSPSTVNLHLKVVSIAFERARRLGYIPLNPCLGLESLKDEDKGERDTFTPEQVQELVEAAKGTEWEGAVLAGFFTGLRLKDVANLLWEEVDSTDSKRWYIRKKTSKTGRTVAVPVHPQFKTWLEPRQAIGKAPVFPSLAGKGTGGKTGLSGQFKQLMEGQGIRGRVMREGGGAGRLTMSLSFHSLRHSFTSVMTNEGVPEEVRMLLIPPI